MLFQTQCSQKCHRDLVGTWPCSRHSGVTACAMCFPHTGCLFSSYSFSFCVCRPEKQSAGKTLHVWCRWTDRIWFLTQREWSAGSAMWSLSLARESCSESVSTASASEEEWECAAGAHLHLLFCICLAVVKKTVFLWVESVCALWFWCRRTLRWRVHTETRPTPATASCKKEKSELWELSFALLLICLFVYKTTGEIHKMVKNGILQL